MKASVPITRGIQSLFGTRDENMRLLESGLGVRTFVRNDSLEIEGEDAQVRRAETILNEYAQVIAAGTPLSNGGPNGYLRVGVADPGG